MSNQTRCYMGEGGTQCVYHKTQPCPTILYELQLNVVSMGALSPMLNSFIFLVPNNRSQMDCH